MSNRTSRRPNCITIGDGFRFGLGLVLVAMLPFMLAVAYLMSYVQLDKLGG